MDNREKHQILKILIGSQEQDLTIRKLSLIRKINYKSAYQAIMKLQREGIVEVKKVGNASQCTFTRKFNPLVFEVENQRRDDLLRNKDIQVFHNTVKKVNGQFIILLFGSQVKGTATKLSDIDLLLISSEVEAKEVESEINLLPYKIHLTHITYEQFVQMLKSKEFSVVGEAIKKNVVLFGVEDFYRFIDNA